MPSLFGGKLLSDNIFKFASLALPCGLFIAILTSQWYFFLYLTHTCNENCIMELYTFHRPFIYVNFSVVAHKYIHGAFYVGKMETDMSTAI